MARSWASAGRLEGRLAVLFMMLTLVPISVEAVVLERVQSDQIAQEVEEHLDTAVELKRVAIGQWVEEKVKRTSLLLSDPQLQGAAADLPARDDEVRARFARVLAIDRDIDELFLLDGSKGTIVVSSDPSKEDRFRDDQPYFRRGREGVFVQPLHYSLPDQGYAIVISGPLPRPQAPEEPPAVLAVRFGPRAVFGLLEDRSGLGETGQTYATNRFGGLLTHEGVPTTVVSGPPASCSVAGGGAGTYRGAGGADVYGVWKWDPGSAVCYVAEQDLSEAFAPVAELRRGLTVGMVVVGLLMLLLSLYVSRLIARPIAERAVAEARLRSLVDNVSAGIAEIDPGGRVSFVNPGIAELRAPRGGALLSPGDPLALRLEAAGVPPPALEQVRAVVERAQPKAIFTLTMPPHHGAAPDAVAREFTCAMHAVAGGTAGSILIVVDVTEQRDAQRALVQRLAELNRTKTQFLNSTAHELNTPITPIVLQLHLLKTRRADNLDEHQRKAVGIIDRNVQRLQRLARDTLDAARLQAGRLRLELRPLDLGAVLREAFESYEVPASLAGVDLVLHAEPGLRVVGDAQRLSQVVSNLLSNALKFTPRGGRVEIAALVEEGNAVVTVHDSGVGILPEDQPKLFQPFSQVQEPLEKSTLGTGLGLYISKGIVEQHGGRIWCLSPGPLGGASFGLALPLAVAAGAVPPAAFLQPPQEASP